MGRQGLRLNESCRAEVKAEGDADTYSRSDAHQRRKQRSLTPELRLTRSMQPPQGSQPHPLPTDQRKNGRSLPVKLEQPAGSGEKPALNQGSSGSPGKGTGSSIQQGGIQKRRNSKPVAADGDGTVKAEVTSNRLRQGTGGASTSGESHSHVDLAAACPDQADAVGGSGGLAVPASVAFIKGRLFPNRCWLFHFDWQASASLAPHFVVLKRTGMFKAGVLLQPALAVM